MYFSSLSFFSSLELSGEKTLLQNLLFNPLACGTCLHLTKLVVAYMGWFQPTKPVEPARNNSFLDAPGGLGLARVLPHNPVTYIVVGLFKRKGSEKLFNSSSSLHRI